MGKFCRQVTIRSRATQRCFGSSNMKRAWVDADVQRASSSDERDDAAAPSALCALGAWQRADPGYDSGADGSEGVNANLTPVQPPIIHPGWRLDPAMSAALPGRTLARLGSNSSSASGDPAASVEACAPKPKGRPMGRTAARRMLTAAIGSGRVRPVPVGEPLAPDTPASPSGRAAPCTHAWRRGDGARQACGGLRPLELAARLPRVEPFGIYEQLVLALSDAITSGEAIEESGRADANTVAAVESILRGAMGNTCLIGSA